MESFGKFKEVFPSKDKFYSSLTKHGICDKKHEYVVSILKTVGITSMKDYHDLYLKRDILLLTYVSESFSSESVDSFELDSAHYFYNPSYSWNVIPRFMGVE